MNLSEYLLSRGLDLATMKSQDDAEDIILVNNALLEETAGLWDSHKATIMLVLQSRINAIGNELLLRAVPQETIVLRQSIVEVGAIADDLEKYSAEWKRRKQKIEPATPAEVDGE